tara:strand:- start:106 stop:399 length:294 start_codon:yes stop_codon:yes gene_type:complete
MNLQIQAIHFNVGNELKELIKKTLNKLLLVDANIISAKVLLKLSKPSSYKNKIVEIILLSKKSKYFAKKQSNSFEESSDLVIQALRKQIIKQKNKLS